MKTVHNKSVFLGLIIFVICFFTNAFDLEASKEDDSLDSPTVEQIVTNLTDIGTTLELIKRLPTSYKICQGFEILFNKLNDSNGFLNRQALQLAHEIKVSIDKETSKSLIETYEAMKMGFPSNIQAIIWGEKVKLRNAMLNEFIFAPDDNFAFDKDRRNVFTWTFKTYKGDDATALWKFETDDGLSFHIKSLRFDEYLYAADTDYDTKRRYAFTWRPKTKDSTMTWKIDVFSEDKIILRYPHRNNEYLYSWGTKFDSTQRHVFTWKPQDAAQESPLADGWWNVIAA